MKIKKQIIMNYNTILSDVNRDFLEHTTNQCKKELYHNIYDGNYIEDIIKIEPFKNKQINIDGSVNIKLKCTCIIINPNVNSEYHITINDVNKMGYSYKSNKLCIFIPTHLCDNKTFQVGDIINIIIIGKRIEEDIICIGKPV